MPARRESFGSLTNLHGGAIATLVDLACALAAARCRGFDHTKESLVTSDMHVRYLGSHRSDDVVARAEVVKVGSRLIVVECKVISGVGDDGGDHVIAVADFSMMVVPRRSRPMPGSDDAGVACRLSAECPGVQFASWATASWIAATVSSMSASVWAVDTKNFSWALSTPRSSSAWENRRRSRESAVRLRSVIDDVGFGEPRFERWWFAGDARPVPLPVRMPLCSAVISRRPFDEELVVHAGCTELLQHREADRAGDRVAAEGARHRHVATGETSDPLGEAHELLRAAHHPDGVSTREALAEGAQVGHHAVVFLCAAVGKAETGHHLVEDRAGSRAARSTSRSALQEPWHRWDRALQRLDDHGGELVGVLLRRFVTVVVRGR